MSVAPTSTNLQVMLPWHSIRETGESDGKRPNILFLAVDDLRPELDTYGAQQMVTPHFDRLAGRGVRTDRWRYKEMRSRGGLGDLLGVGLFDLENDPDENRNVAECPAHADVRQKLKAMLDATQAGFDP